MTAESPVGLAGGEGSAVLYNSNCPPETMFVPTFPTPSVALSKNFPTPELIADFNNNVPFQLLPAPDNVTAVLLPMGPWYCSVGVVPGCAVRSRSGSP